MSVVRLIRIKLALLLWWLASEVVRLSDRVSNKLETNHNFNSKIVFMSQSIEHRAPITQKLKLGEKNKKESDSVGAAVHPSRRSAS